MATSSPTAGVNRPSEQSHFSVMMTPFVIDD
jgi:hypothetical protein